jgi:signal transduction histidine kinase
MPLDERIEPGILPAFRLFVGVHWLLLSLSLFVLTRKLRVLPDYMMIFGWMQCTFLGIYLLWNWLCRALGAFYLPIALFVASVGPVVSQAVAIALRLGNGLPIEAALVDPRRLYIWLLLPFLLIAMQYGYRVLFCFTLGTSFLSALLAHQLDPEGGAIAASLTRQAVSRLFVFAVAGVIILLLSKVQRKQRRELAEKNAQLAHYATTLEQLAVSRERNRIARDLHDTLAHTLSAVSVQLKALEVLWDTDPETARKTLKQTQDLTRTGLHEARRALQSLRASPIEELGLALALKQLIEQVTERIGLQVRLDLPVQLNGLRPEVEQQVYRIAEEALNNVVRHSNARVLKVCLRQEHAHLTLTIADDGVGFDLANVAKKGHYGLVGMQERALLIDGRLEIQSLSQQGTTVQLDVDL